MSETKSLRRRNLCIVSDQLACVQTRLRQLAYAYGELVYGGECV